MIEAPTKNRRGRPAASEAVAHERILDAVGSILQERSVRDLTIEEVARRAGVGKPTIYKWWPSKARLIIGFMDERFPKSFVPADSLSLADTLRQQIAEHVGMLGGFYGKILRELIGEGQSDPDTLEQVRLRYLAKREALDSGLLAAAKAAGEIREGIDSGTLIDLIYGPIYYRLLFQHDPLDQAFAQKVVNDVLACNKPG